MEENFEIEEEETLLKNLDKFVNQKEKGTI